MARNTKGNNNQQDQQAQEEATAATAPAAASTWETVYEHSESLDLSLQAAAAEAAAAAADWLASAWTVIHGFTYDTNGFIIDGKPTWAPVSTVELTSFTQSTSAADAATDIDLDRVPSNSVAIVRAGIADLMENRFETYYTLRPAALTFPEISWVTDITTAYWSYQANDIIYSAGEQTGLTARYGDPRSGQFGAEAIDYKLKSKYRSFLEGLSSSSIRNQTINPKISYNDARTIDVTEIKGAQQPSETPREADASASSAGATSGAY
jgi:hypothetical protein